MDKIIFFHMNQLGDLLFSLPVLQAVKKQCPDIKIYSVARKNLAGLLNAAGIVDKIFIKEKTFKSKLRLIFNIRAEKLDAAVMFSESPETLLTAFCSGIKKRFGFKTAGLNFLLTDKSAKTGAPSLANNITLAKNLGVENVKTDYLNIIKTDAVSDVAAQRWLSENGILENNFIVISMGASKRRQDKCLREEVWVETFNRLAVKKIDVVVVGAKWEQSSIESVTAKCSSKIKVFCPEGGLLALASLMKKAKLFVGIDSGAMHLAASLGVKCVALYGNTDPFKIGPQPLSSHIIIKKASAKDISADDITNEINL